MKPKSSLFKRINSMIATGILILNSNLFAQKAEPVAVLTQYTITSGEYKPVYTSISDYVNGSLPNKSNIMTEAFREEQDSSIIWVIERWENRKEFKNARASKYYRAIDQLVRSKHLTKIREVYVTDLSLLSKDEWRKSTRENQDELTIMLFVDGMPGTEEKFKSTYQEALPKFRSEPGVINYQLSQLDTDKTQFVTYEKFRNEAAFQYHLGFPPIQPVIDYLNTSIKEQPFQRGLHRLIQFAPVR